jgi:uncharacterized protein with ATP-grasp and redox domains
VLCFRNSGVFKRNEMEELLILGIIGVIAIVGWLAKLISNLKNGIDAQKLIIDSMASQSTYINNVHTIVSKLYDPAEIEKLVSTKTQLEMTKYQGNFDEVLKHHSNLVQTLYRYIGASVAYSDSEQLSSVFNSVATDFRSKELEDFALELRKEIESSRQETTSRLLGGFTKK